ncbi:MAG TPA: hypothetical protein V6D30_22055 [Leptolyngbyaceae cyanobacterium]
MANLSYDLMRSLPQHRQLETEKIERWVERQILSILKFRFFYFIKKLELEFQLQLI